MADRGDLSAVGIGTLAAGAVLVWSGLKGSSVLSAVQDIIRGKKPAGANVHQIQGQAAGTGADGTPIGTGGKSKVTGPNITARMRAVLNDVDSKFGAFPVIGCYRGGAGAQDHALGKACDFMETLTGRMPTPQQQTHGDHVAAYLVQNAERLGISYVIWKQHIWNIKRASEGWRAMADRGSITQNHYDHVHVSVQ